MKNLYIILVLCFNVVAFSQSSDWKLVSPFITSHAVDKVEHFGNFVYTKTNQKFYVSNDSGVFWKLVSLTDVYDFEVKNNKGYRLGNGIKFVVSDIGFANDSHTYEFTTPETFHKIFVLNDNFIILGGAGKIAKSTDGGHTWTLHIINAGAYAATMKDFYFLDEYIGFAVGNGPFNKYIFKTVDGGVNWSIVYTDSSNATFTQIIFKDNMNGLAIDSNGYYFYTQDAGNTWTKQNINWNTAVKAIKLHNGLYYGVGNVSNVLTSADGINWAQTSVNIPNSLPYKFTWLSVDQNQMIIGTSNEMSVASAGPAALIKTTDFQNFTMLEQHIPYGNFMNLDVVDVHALVSMGAAGGRTYRTHDKGTTWDFINNNRGTIELFPSGKGILIPSLNYKITNDFGNTFTIKTAPTNITTGCLLPNDNHVLGYYDTNTQAGSVGIYNNQTNTYTPKSSAFVVPGGAIQKIKFADNLNGFLFNLTGIYKTTDGGQTWTAVTNHPEYFPDIDDIVFDGVSKIYIGKYFTSDMGATWVQTVPSGVSYAFKHYKIFADGTGYGVHDLSVYKTTDSGASWNIVMNPNIQFPHQKFNRVGFSKKFIVGITDQSNMYVYDLETQNLSTEGVVETIKNDDVYIFPNPTSSELNISLKEKLNLEVYDYSGRLILNKATNNSKIDVSSLKNGNYILSIKTPTQIFVRKFIKN